MKLTDYRPFGRTGVKVSPLTLGCMMFGGRPDLDDSCRIIDLAIDAGINILDAANVDSLGRSEEVTGEALKRNGRREQIPPGSHVAPFYEANFGPGLYRW